MDITLTQEQIQKIMTDMYYQSSMLTDEEVNALAETVNKAVNLPFIGEEKEFIVMVKLIKWIDSQLYSLLPNEYYELVHNAHDGISREEAIQIGNRVAPLINKIVDIPIVSEAIEGYIINMVVQLIVNAMIKGFKLEQKKIVS
jgi:hypothetical protein